MFIAQVWHCGQTLQADIPAHAFERFHYPDVFFNLNEAFETTATARNPSQSDIAGSGILLTMRTPRLQSSKDNKGTMKSHIKAFMSQELRNSNLRDFLLSLALQLRPTNFHLPQRQFYTPQIRLYLPGSITVAQDAS